MPGHTHEAAPIQAFNELRALINAEKDYLQAGQAWLHFNEKYKNEIEQDENLAVQNNLLHQEILNNAVRQIESYLITDDIALQKIAIEKLNKYVRIKEESLLQSDEFYLRYLQCLKRYKFPSQFYKAPLLALSSNPLFLFQGLSENPNETQTILDYIWEIRDKNFLIELLQKAGINSLDDSVDEEGNTLLHYAMLYKQDQFVSFLLSQDARSNIKNNKNETAFSLADQQQKALILQVKDPRILFHKLSENPDEAKILLDYIWEIDDKDFLNTVLQKAGVTDLNAPIDNQGNTLLHYAIINQQHQFVPFLLSQGAHSNIKNNKNETADSLADQQQQTLINAIENPIFLFQKLLENPSEPLLDYIWGINDKNFLIELVKKAGIADLNAVDPEGNTLLHYAMINHHDRFAAFLLSQGARSNIRNNKNETAYSLADQQQKALIKGPLYDREFITIEIDGNKLQMPISDFANIHKFEGAGNFGEVVRVEYVVDENQLNPNEQQLINRLKKRYQPNINPETGKAHYWFIVKSTQDTSPAAKKTFEQEMVHTDELSKPFLNDPENCPYNFGCSARYDNDLPVILSQIENYDFVKKGFQYVPQSGDLGIFTRQVANQIGTAAINPAENLKAYFEQRAYTANINITLLQIINSLHESIRAMHVRNKLHLDLAARNILVSRPITTIINGQKIVVGQRVRAADYGYMVNKDANGNGKENQPIVPIRWAYKDRLINSHTPEHNIPIKDNSDLYSAQVIFLELVANLSKKTIQDVTTPTAIEAGFNERDSSHKAVWDVYLKNLENVAIDSNNLILANFVTSFKPLLTKEIVTKDVYDQLQPEAQKDYLTIEQFEVELTILTNQIIINTLEEKISDYRANFPSDPNKAALDLIFDVNQLLAIPFTQLDPEQALTKAMKAIANSQPNDSNFSKHVEATKLSLLPLVAPSSLIDAASLVDEFDQSYQALQSSAKKLITAKEAPAFSEYEKAAQFDYDKQLQRINDLKTELEILKEHSNISTIENHKVICDKYLLKLDRVQNALTKDHQIWKAFELSYKDAKKQEIKKLTKSLHDYVKQYQDYKKNINKLLKNPVNIPYFGVALGLIKKINDAAHQINQLNQIPNQQIELATKELTASLESLINNQESELKFWERKARHQVKLQVIWNNFIDITREDLEVKAIIPKKRGTKSTNKEMEENESRNRSKTYQAMAKKAEQDSHASPAHQEQRLAALSPAVPFILELKNFPAFTNNNFTDLFNLMNRFNVLENKKFIELNRLPENVFEQERENLKSTIDYLKNLKDAYLYANRAMLGNEEYVRGQFISTTQMAAISTALGVELSEQQMHAAQFLQPFLNEAKIKELENNSKLLLEKESLLIVSKEAISNLEKNLSTKNPHTTQILASLTDIINFGLAQNTNSEQGKAFYEYVMKFILEIKDKSLNEIVQQIELNSDKKNKNLAKQKNLPIKKLKALKVAIQEYNENVKRQVLDQNHANQDLKVTLAKKATSTIPPQKQEVEEQPVVTQEQKQEEKEPVVTQKQEEESVVIQQQNQGNGAELTSNFTQEEIISKANEFREVNEYLFGQMTRKDIANVSNKYPSEKYLAYAQAMENMVFSITADVFKQPTITNQLVKIQFYMCVMQESAEKNDFATASIIQSALKNAHLNTLTEHVLKDNQTPPQFQELIDRLKEPRVFYEVLGQTKSAPPLPSYVPVRSKLLSLSGDLEFFNKVVDRAVEFQQNYFAEHKIPSKNDLNKTQKAWLKEKHKPDDNIEDLKSISTFSIKEQADEIKKAEVPTPPAFVSKTLKLDPGIQNALEKRDEIVKEQKKIIEDKKIPLRLIDEKILKLKYEAQPLRFDTKVERNRRQKLQMVIDNLFNPHNSLNTTGFQGSTSQAALQNRIDYLRQLIEKKNSSLHKHAFFVLDKTKDTRAIKLLKELKTQTEALLAQQIALDKLNDINPDRYQKIIGTFHENTAKENMRHLMPRDMREYVKENEKEGGANQPGKHGGIYSVQFRKNDTNDTRKQMVMLKQDTKDDTIRHHKNIAEVVSSRLMNAASGHNDTAASCYFVHSIDDKQGNDKSGNHVYVGSIFYDNYTDLFEVLGFKERPKYLGTFNKSKFLKAFCMTDQKGNFILDKRGRKRCAFDNLSKVIASSLLTGDFDLHTGNIGVTFESVKQEDITFYDLCSKLFVNHQFLASQGIDWPKTIADIMNGTYKDDPQHQAAIKALAKKCGLNVPRDQTTFDTVKQLKFLMLRRGVVKGKLVKIDHGGAMFDLEDRVHMHSRFRHPPGLGPTNHIRELPRDLKIIPEFAQELEAEAAVNLSNEVELAMQEVKEFYDIEPILDFAMVIGMDISSYEDQLEELTEKGRASFRVKLISDIQSWLTDKMAARQQSYKELALEIRLSLCFIKDKTKFFTTWKFDEAEIKFGELIKANPSYFLTGQFHFRGKDQGGDKKTLTKKTNEQLINHFDALLAGMIEHCKQTNSASDLDLLLNNKYLISNNEVASKLNDAIKKDPIFAKIVSKHIENLIINESKVYAAQSDRYIHTYIHACISQMAEYTKDPENHATDINLKPIEQFLSFLITNPKQLNAYLSRYGQESIDQLKQCYQSSLDKIAQGLNVTSKKLFLSYDIYHIQAGFKTAPDELSRIKANLSNYMNLEFKEAKTAAEQVLIAERWISIMLRLFNKNDYQMSSILCELLYGKNANHIHSFIPTSKLLSPASLNALKLVMKTLNIDSIHQDKNDALDEELFNAILDQVESKLDVVPTFEYLSKRIAVTKPMSTKPQEQIIGLQEALLSQVKNSVASANQYSFNTLTEQSGQVSALGQSNVVKASPDLIRVVTEQLVTDENDLKNVEKTRLLMAEHAKKGEKKNILHAQKFNGTYIKPEKDIKSDEDIKPANKVDYNKSPKKGHGFGIFDSPKVTTVVTTKKLPKDSNSQLNEILSLLGEMEGNMDINKVDIKNKDQKSEVEEPSNNKRNN